MLTLIPCKLTTEFVSSTTFLKLNDLTIKLNAEVKCKWSGRSPRSAGYGLDTHYASQIIVGPLQHKLTCNNQGKTISG